MVDTNIKTPEPKLAKRPGASSSLKMPKVTNLNSTHF